VLAFFRRDFLGVQIILLAYTLVLRGVGFFGKIPDTKLVHQNGYLFERWLAQVDAQAWWVYLLSAICIWLQAIMINRLANEHKFTERKTWFISLAYVLLASFALDAHPISPTLIANFFFITAISELFYTFRVADCRKSIFNAGFFLALGALCSSQLLWMAIPFYLGFRSLRSFRIQEQLIFLIGLVVPFVLLGSYSILQDDFDRFWNTLAIPQFALPNFMHLMTPKGITTIAGYALLVVFVFFSAFRYLSKRGIQSQKYIAIMYWLLIAGLVLLIFRTSFGLHSIYLILPSMAVFCGISLEQAKNHQVAELLHALFLAVLFSLHYLIPA
jgi:hypothetical protein